MKRKYLRAIKQYLMGILNRDLMGIIFYDKLNFLLLDQFGSLSIYQQVCCLMNVLLDLVIDKSLIKKFISAQ